MKEILLIFFLSSISRVWQYICQENSPPFEATIVCRMIFFYHEENNFTLEKFFGMRQDFMVAMGGNLIRVIRLVLKYFLFFFKKVILSKNRLIPCTAVI